MEFAHLHTHSHYSLLNALPPIKGLVEAAKKDGATSMALTDADSLYGVVEFYNACKSEGIKPIIGLDTHIAKEHRTVKRAQLDKKSWQLVLLAKNETGYKNLLKLSTIGFLEGFYYTPRIDNEILGELKEGLIALSGGIGGQIPQMLKQGDRKKAKEAAEFYESLLGKGNFYLELVRRKNDGEQSHLNTELIELSKETGIPLVATSNNYYLKPTDHDAWEALRCIQKGQTLEEFRRMSGIDTDLSLSSAEEMIEEFKSIEGAIANTTKIAEQCNLEIDLGNNYLPVYEMPEGKTDSELLKEMCEEGIKKKYKEITPEVTQRFNFEFETINKMGFASYFLIVQDFVNFAKNRGILVGPGRGSAAGSLISYVLGITDLDPLRYGLLFERFLNPDRISMPDVDMDFADSRRAEVLEYVRDKYGTDHVAGIITFGKMMPKAAVRDSARVLALPYEEGDRIAKMVPDPIQGRHTPLDTAIKESPDLRNDYQSNSITRQVVDLAMKLEGTPRHASQHACGVVISDKPLTHYVPLQESQHEDLDYVSQYSLGPVEAAGLVKMDFLGLSNLTIIENALKIIEAVHGVTIDIDTIPLDDKETFQLMGRGETVGVFQLESEGMQRYLIELEPSEFNDVVAMCALYRPGPLSAGMVPQYINRKNGREEVKYDHPLMEEILKETYGVTVYQEQIMKISRELAGFTGGEADTLRKAMGKKKHDILAKMKSQFISGCKKNNIEEKISKKIWTDWEGFADYAFNKSHSACYGMIAYRTGYLKAKYPAEFMAAVMDSDAGNIDRIMIEVQECTRMGIEVLPPDINESFVSFGVTGKNGSIRWGLNAIKNVGGEVAEAIVKERKENGPYKDLCDFATRIRSKTFNRKSLESLAMTGAFDTFEDRGVVLSNTDIILKYNRQLQKEAESAQTNLFDLSPEMKTTALQLMPAPNAKKSLKLSWERELLGIYVSEHPFQEYSKILGNTVTYSNKIESMKDRDSIKAAGVISTIRAIVTKKGDPMAFVRIEDHLGAVECVFFPKIYKQYKTYLDEGQAIVVIGKVSEREGQAKSILVDSIVCFTEDSIEEIKKMLKAGMWVAEEVHQQAKQGEEKKETERKVVISLHGSLSEKQTNELREVFKRRAGTAKVFFALESGGRVKQIKTGYSITPTNAIIDAIKEIVGSKNVNVVE